MKISVNLGEFVNYTCVIVAAMFQVALEEKAPGENWWKYMMKDQLKIAMIPTTTQLKRCEFYHVRNIDAVFITGGLRGHSNAARDECQRVSTAWRRSDKGIQYTEVCIV